MNRNRSCFRILSRVFTSSDMVTFSPLVSTSSRFEVIIVVVPSGRLGLFIVPIGGRGVLGEVELEWGKGLLKNGLKEELALEMRVEAVEKGRAVAESPASGESSWPKESVVFGVKAAPSSKSWGEGECHAELAPANPSEVSLLWPSWMVVGGSM